MLTIQCNCGTKYEVEISGNFNADAGDEYLYYRCPNCNSETEIVARFYLEHVTEYIPDTKGDIRFDLREK